MKPTRERTPVQKFMFESWVDEDSKTSKKKIFTCPHGRKFLMKENGRMVLLENKAKTTTEKVKQTKQATKKCGKPCVKMNTKCAPKRLGKAATPKTQKAVKAKNGLKKKVHFNRHIDVIKE